MTSVDRGTGLYRKFIVQRADGSSAPGGKYEECSYFVLDWDHDPFAVPAARAYADACEARYPALARDLRALADKHAVRWAAAPAVGELLQAALDMGAPPQTNNEEVERRRRAEATTRFEKLKAEDDARRQRLRDANAAWVAAGYPPIGPACDAAQDAFREVVTSLSPPPAGLRYAFDDAGEVVLCDAASGELVS